MSQLFDNRGQLFDFIPRQGDPPQPSNEATRQRWGKRVLLSTADRNDLPPLGFKPTATLISTQVLPRMVPLDLQVRFASAQLSVTPPSAMPINFTYINPVVLSGVLTFAIRRGVDMNAQIATDTVTMNLGASNDIFPLDIVVARQLEIVVTLTGTQVAVWVEMSATPTDVISPANLVPGYGQVQGPLGAAGLQVGAVASPAFATLLVARRARTQFLITNTSTNADLYVLFGGNATAGPPAQASLIIPSGGFQTYESPIGGWNGLVTGSWANAAPNGGALVTEGSYW